MSSKTAASLRHVARVHSILAQLLLLTNTRKSSVGLESTWTSVLVDRTVAQRGSVVVLSIDRASSLLFERRTHSRRCTQSIGWKSSSSHSIEKNIMKYCSDRSRTRLIHIEMIDDCGTSSAQSLENENERAYVRGREIGDRDEDR